MNPVIKIIRGLLYAGVVAATVVAFVCATPATGLGAIATVSTTNATNGNTKNFAISPAAVTGGNFLVAHIVLDGTTTAPIGPDGSWTLRNTSTNAGGNLVLTTWTHTVTAGETPTYTWNYAASNMAWAGGITQYSGVDPFCPVGATGTANGTSVTVNKRSTFTLPVITTVIGNAVTDGGYGVSVKNKTFTPPAGWTGCVAARRPSGGPTAGSSNRGQAAAGSTGANTVTVNVTANPYVADLIELDAADATGLTLTPSTMSFSTNQGSSPASQTFTITNIHTKPGCANDTYTAAVGSFSTGWGATELPAPNVAAVSLAKGVTSGAITVSIGSSSLASGTYTALITITDGRGNTATISVILVVNCGMVTRRGNVATNTASAATALMLTEPGGWSDGDVLVATLIANTTTAPATPAGWTLIGSATTGGNLGQWVYERVKNGSATTTWNGFASGKLAGAMTAFPGVNDVTPISAPPTPFTPAPTGSGNGNVDTNACTTAGINTEVVAAYAVNAASAGTGLTVGTGLTSITGNVSTGGAIGDVVLNMGSDRIIAAAGTVLAETGSVAPSQSASKLGALFAINPKLAQPAMNVTRVPLNPIQGDTVTYTIVVTNPASNVPIAGFTISDTLPAGVTFVSLTADAAGSGLTMSANAGAGAVEGAYGTLTTPLAGGSRVVFTLVGSVGCGAVVAQSSTVFAYTGGTCGAPASMLDAFTPGVVAAPAVTVTRTPAVPTQGDTVTYAITVQNMNATAPLNALMMSDTLPAGVTFVSLTADSAGNGLTISANAGAGAVEGASGTLTTPLAAGNTATFTLVGTVGCAAVAAQSDQAYARTPSNCKNAVSTADSFTPAAVNAAPTVTVSHNPTSPAPGSTVTYMIVVANNSAAALNVLTVSDTLPAGVDFVSLEGGSDGSGDGLTMSANAGAGAVEGVSGAFTPGLELAAGASFTLTLTGTVNCAASGAQSHQAYAQTAANCRNGLSTADSFSVPTVGLSIVKTQVAPAAGAAITAGNPVQYRIVVTNTGGVTLTSLLVVDTVGPQVVNVTTTATGFALPAVADSVGGTGTVYAWSGTGLAMGPNWSYTFTISGQAGTACAPVVLGNTAYVTAGNVCGAGLLPSSAASGTFTLGPPALGVSVAKEQVPASPGVGEAVTYRVIVTNNGGATIAAVTVVDTVTAVIMNVVVDQPTGFGAPVVTNETGGTRFVWIGSGLNLVSGASYTFTIAGKVGLVCGSTSVTDTAYIVAGAACGARVEAFTNRVEFAVSPAPLGITVAKEQVPASPGVGEAVTYRVIVKNTGAATVANLTVVDTVTAVIMNVVVDQPTGFGAPVVTNETGGTRFVWIGSGLNLVSGASYTFTIAGKVGLVCGSMSVTDTAYVVAAPFCGARVEAFTNRVEFAVSPAPLGITVAKEQVPASPGVGEAVTYRVIVKNTGAATVANLTVVDTVTAVIMNVVVDQPTGFGAPVVTNETGGTRFVWIGSGLNLVSGASYTFTIAGKVGLVCGSMSVTDTAYVVAAPFCGAGVEAFTNRVEFAVSPAPLGIAVAKEQVPASPGVGEAVTYRVIVKNTGAATVANLTVVDTVMAVIANVVVDQPTGFGAPVVTNETGGTRFVWIGSGLNLVSGASYTFTIAGKVGLVCGSTSVTDTAYVVAAPFCGAGVEAFTNRVGFEVAPPVHALDATLAQDPATPQIGEAISYRIVVRNTGTATVIGVIVIDTVSPVLRGVTTAQPAGFAAPAVASIPLTGTRYTWSANGLALLPGATYTFTITGSIGLVCAATNVASTAYASTTTACGSLAGLSNPVGHMVLAPVSAVSVGIIQTPPAPGMGEPVVLYQIDVTNSGTATITALTVTDTVSPVLTGISTTEPGGWAAPAVTSVAGVGTRYEWSLTGFQFVPGETLTFWVGGSMGLVCADTAVTNRTAVWGPSACATVRALSAEVGGTVAAPVTALTVTKEQSPAAPGIGDTVTYRIIAANTGIATLVSLTVSDTVAPEVTGIIANAPAAMGAPVVTDVSGVGTRYVWSAGSLFLLPGTSWTFTITGRVGVVCAVTPVGNKGFVQAVSDCATTEGVTNAVSFSLAPSPVGIAATVELSPPSPGVGDPVTYRVIVTNNGSATVTALTVTDTIAPVVTGASAVQPGGWSAPTVTSVVGGTRYVWTASGLSLNPGKNFTFTITGAVGLVCGTLVAPNRAHAVAVTLCADTEALSNTPSFTVDPPMASITAAKEQSPASPGAGEPVTYRIMIANTGTATLTELTIIDTVSPTVTGTAGDGPAAMGAPTVTSVAGGTRYLWNRTGLTMYPGTVWTFTISGKVGAVCSATAVTNTAYAMAGAICGGADAYTNRVQFLAAPAAAGMSVVADQIPSSPVTGEAVTYRIVVTNTGATTLSGLTVVDTVSPVVTGPVTDGPPVMGSATLTNVAGGSRYEWTATGLAMYPGAAYTFTISGLVGQVCTATTVTNRAHAAGRDPCVVLNGVTTAASFSIDPATASITAVKEQSPVSPGVGEPVTYRMVLANTGTATLTELTVIDTISPVVTGVTTDAPAAMGAPAVTSVAGGTRYLWNRSGITMYPGTVWTFTISGVVGAVCSPTAVTNTGFVIGFGPCGGADAYTNRVQFLVAPAASAITVAKEQDPAAPGVGEPVTYRIIVTNTGAATLTGLTVIDTIAPVVVNVSTAEPSGFGPPSTVSVLGTGTQYVWNASGLNLVSGAWYTFTITGMVGPVCAATAVTGTAYVVAATSCGPQTDGYSNRVEFMAAPAAASMTVGKEQSPASPQIGEPVTYRIFVTNTGGVTLTDLTVVDTVSPVIVGVNTAEPSGFGPPSTVSVLGTGTRYVWSGSGLAFMPGATYTFTVTGSVGLVCAETAVTGTAYVIAAGCGANLGEFTNRTESIVTPAVAAITVTKEQSPASPQTGEPVTYRVIVTNTGSATVDAITVTDTISPVIVSVGTGEPSGFALPITTSVIGTGTRYVWTATGLNLTYGASYTFTVTGFVGPVCATTSVSNTASVSASAGCASAQAQTNPAWFTVAGPVLDITAVKEMFPASPQVGEPVTYRIVVANIGSETIAALTVFDTVSPVVVGVTTAEPAGFGTPVITHVAGGTAYSWSAAGLSMYPGAVYTFTVTGKIGAVCTATGISDTGYVWAQGACNILVALTNGVGHIVQPPTAVIIVTKEQSPASPAIGETVTYRIIVTNVGGATIDAITVTDTLSPVIVNTTTVEPPGFGLPSTVSVLGTGTRYEWSAVGLGMSWGTTYTFTVTGKVGPVCASIAITDTAYVTALPVCGAGTAGFTNRVEFTAGPTDPALVVVREQFPAAPGVGDAVTYRIMVTNTGGTTIDNLTVVDTISPVIVNVSTAEPAGFGGGPTIVSIVGIGTRYEWSAAGLGMGWGTTYTFTIAGRVGFVCSSIAVTGTGFATGDPVCGPGTGALANLTAFIVAPAVPAVVVTKALIVSPSGVGEAVAYRIVVTNTGGATIDSLTVVDTISPVIVGQSSAEPSGFGPPSTVSVLGIGTRYEWSASGLNFGWSKGYTFTISGKVGLVCAATNVDNPACVAGADICLNGTGGVSNSVGFAVIPPATDVTVTKQQDPAVPAIGDTVTYRLIVANTGAATVTDLTVTDTVSPTIVEAAYDQPSTWTAPVVSQVSGGTRYAWSGTGLAMLPGAVYTFTITGKVGPVCVQTTVSNTAYVTAAADCPAVGKYSNRTDFLVTAPILGFTVVAEQTPAAFGVGEPVVYRIVVTNTGDITIENMTILDTVSPVLTGATADQPSGWPSPTVTSIAGAGTRYEWNVGGLTMFPGTDLTFTISGKAGLVCAPTQVSNTVYIFAGTSCADLDAFTKATGVLVQPPAVALAVEKTQTPAEPGVGSAVTYRIVVTNAGQATVDSLNLTDTVSPVVVSASTDQPSGWSTPTVASIVGAGTRYAWSRTGFAMSPGTAYTFTVTGMVGLVCANTAVGNTAYAAGETACGGAYQYSNGTGFAVLSPVASLVAVREQAPASPQVGEAVTYRIVVANTGTATLENLSVIDTVSPVLTGAKTDQPSGWAVPVLTQVADGTRYEWSYGSALGMTPGTVYTFTVTGLVGLVCVPTPVTGTAYVFGGKACGEKAILTNGTSFDVAPPTPGMTMAKEQDPAAPGIGEAVTYRIVVTNTGTMTVEQLTVTDTLSPVITGIAPDQPAGFAAPVVTAAGSGTIYAWTGAGLGMVPGSSYTFTISGRVGPVCALTAVGDRAFGTAGAPCGLIDAASLAPTFNVSPPDTSISIVKEQDVPVPGIGEPVTYRVMVTNTGGTTIETMTVVDTVSPVIVNVGTAEPSGFGIPSTVSVLGSGTRYEWTAAGLGMIPGTTYTFTISGAIGLVCADTDVSNTAYAVAAPACGNRTEGFSGVVGFTVTPPVTSITVVKEQAPSSPGVGEEVTYRIVVENTGTATLTALTVTDTVSPVIVNAVADQPGTWSAPTLTQEAGGTRYEWSKAGIFLAPGSVYTFTISGSIGAVCGPIVVTNTAYVAASSDCAVVMVDTNRVEFTVVPQPLGFTIAKEMEPVAPGIGEQVTYRIIVANTGGITIDGLVVTDTIAPVVTGASADQPGGWSAPTVASVVGGTLYAWSATGIGMNPGTSYTFTVMGRIGPVCAPTTVDNTAYGAAASACSAAETSASAAGFTVQPAVPAVTVVMEQEPAAPQVGEAITYRIVVTNSGTATLAALTITDTLSPVIVNAGTAEPSGFGLPITTSVIGTGTHYLWSGTGLFMTPGTTYTFTVTGRIGLVCADTVVGNAGYALGTDYCSSTESAAGTPGFTVNPPVTAIAVARERTPVSPGVGDAVTYRIIVANTGTATVTDLVVVDTISAVIVGTSADQPAGWSAPAVMSVSGGTRFAWSGTGLAMTPGSVYTFTIMGSAGSVCVQTTITGTTFAAAASACGPVSAFSNMTWFVIAGQDLSYTATVEQLPAVPMVGEPLAYRIVVMNTGGVTIENLTIMDTITPIILGASTGEPSGFATPTIASIVGTGTLYVWEATGLNMVPNTVYTFTVAGTAGPVCADTGITNQALVVAGMSCDSAELDSNTANSTIAAPIRSLAVVKSQEPASLGIGEAVTYRIVVTNTGSATIESLDLTDTVSPVIVNAGTAEPSGFGPPSTVSVLGTGTRYVWSATGLNMIPGTTYTFTVTGMVGLVCAATPVGGPAHAAGISACATTDVISNTAGSTVQPAAAAVSAVMEQAPASATVGVEVTYRIIVANTGGMTVDSITVTDTVQPEIMVTGTAEPSGFGPPTIVPIVGMGTKYEWAAAGLNMVPGTVYTFTVTGRIGTVCGTVHVGNTAWVSAGADCMVAGQGTNGIGFDVDAPAAHLSAAASASPSVVQGRWFELRLTVTNTGSMDASAVTPSVTAFVGESRLSNAAGPVPASAPILAIGGSATFAYTFTASGRGLVVFTATAEGTTCSSASILGVAQVSVTLLAPAALAAGVAVYPAVTGQNFTVTVTVTNTGDITANGISVPAPSFAGSGAVSLVSGANPATRATLNGGSTVTFTWIFAATGSGSAVFSTGATGTDSESAAPLTTGTISSASSINPPAVPNLVVNSFTAGPARVELDRIVTVTFTVQNTGWTAATGLTPVLAMTGAGRVEPVISPTAINLAAGATDTFTWTYRTLAGGSLAFNVTASSNNGASVTASAPANIVIVEVGTSVDQAEVYPLPFDPSTALGGTLKFRRMPAFTSVRIYTIAGEIIASATADANGLVEWDGRNKNGSKVTGGVYFYMLKPPQGKTKVGKLEVGRGR